MVRHRLPLLGGSRARCWLEALRVVLQSLFSGWFVGLPLVLKRHIWRRLFVLPMHFLLLKRTILVTHLLVILVRRLLQMVGMRSRVLRP